MEKRHKVFIAGSGGIGRAAGLMLRELGDLSVDLYMGDVNAAAAEAACDWIGSGSARPGEIHALTMPREGTNAAQNAVLEQCDIVLDCLPGSQAPRMAGLAREHGLHYVNLTEYVAETTVVSEIARGAETGFILQTGLAPGYIGVLAHGLFQQFCSRFGVKTVDYISMKVGALTRNVVEPHFYGFTWSPAGVATEYVKPTIVIRDYQKTERPALSERESTLIEGRPYEADLTSGGAADLPDALSGKTRELDYKTLRYPGHYAWVARQLQDLPENSDQAGLLQSKMQGIIPLVEDDVVVMHAFVQGADANGVIRLLEKANHIYPMQINGKTLRAIQTTTAAPLVECARMLLKGNLKGVILQSTLDPESFLQGPYVKAVYG